MSLGPPIRKPQEQPVPKERPHPTNPDIIIGSDGKWRTRDMSVPRPEPNKKP